MGIEEKFLIHPPLDFDFAFWDRFEIESSLSGRNLEPIEGGLKIRQEFECKGCRFGLCFLCKNFGNFHHCKAII